MRYGGHCFKVWNMSVNTKVALKPPNRLETSHTLRPQKQGPNSLHTGISFLKFIVKKVTDVTKHHSCPHSTQHTTMIELALGCDALSLWLWPCPWRRSPPDIWSHRKRSGAPSAFSPGSGTINISCPKTALTFCWMASIS